MTITTIRVKTLLMPALVVLVIAALTFTIFPGTTANAAAVNANIASVEWSSSSDHFLDVLQEQTSRLLGDSYDAMVEQTRQIRNEINDRVNANQYLRNALDSAAGAAAALANASPQQLQIINDAVSMLGANYAYDAAQREIDLHRDCIAAAYRDLSSAARIVMDGAATTATTATSDGASENWQRMRQVQEHVLSAVRHLQDSCPLCRALKYAASEANRNLLPFVTVLSSSILKSLHPFVAEADPYELS